MTLTASSLIALLPIIILGAGAVLGMLAIAIRRSHAFVFGLTLVVFLLAFIGVLFSSAQGTIQVTPLLVFDGFGALISALVVAACFVVTLLAYGYLKLHRGNAEEFYLLLISAALGCVVLAASSHFASFFLGLEILSISLYAMIAYTYETALGVEAAVKYLVLASSSAAFLLFGMALIYMAQGSMEFARIAANLSALGAAASAGAPLPITMLAGSVLMMVGIGYKLALVPFHLWTPDVYEGAPAPVTAFVATVSKGSMFAVLLRFFNQLNVSTHPQLYTVFVVIAVATMLVGALLALQQSNLKRLLAYSSIANLGYLLVAFMAGGQNAITASTFYLISYFITILAAFGVVTVLSSSERDAGSLEEYRGLMWRRPWLAALLAGCMFSLAGIPLTVGFVGKFYLVLAGVGSALWLLVIVLVLSSAISLFYYLRVIVMMFAPTESTPAKGAVAQVAAPSMTLAGGLALAALAVLIVWLGVYPAPLLQMIQTVAAAAR